MSEERTFADFDLLIEGQGNEGYRARVLDSPAGGAAGSFALPFSDMEMELFLLKVGRPRRGTRRLESPEMEAAREFGKKLYEAVFHDDLRLSLRRSLDEAERRDQGLRIRLRFSDAPELASIPWEFLYDEDEDQFLVLSAWTPIVRYLDLTQRVEPLTVDGPLRILVMISSPHDFPALDVEEEWRRITQALRPLTDAGLVVLDRAEEATLLNLQRRLRKNEYHIFHFLGHGGFDDKAEDGVLVMEDGQNRSRLVAGRDLGTILNDHRALRLAVLNACEGARAGDEDLFSGVAQSMIRKGIPAAVAMQFEITDAAAIAFAQEFYGAIADSYPVDAAIGEARRAIFGLGNDIEWGTPVVYLRGDGRLFDVRTSPVERDDVTTAAAAAATTAAVVEEPEAEVAEPEPDPEPEPEPEVAELEPEPESEVEPEPEPVSVSEPEPEPEPEPEVAEVVAVTAERPTSEVADEPLVASQPPATTRAGIPTWLMVALGIVGAVVVILVAVNLIGGEPTLPTLDDAVDESGVTEATPATTAPTATTVFADDGLALAQRIDEPKAIDGRPEDWPGGVNHTVDHAIYYASAVRADPGGRVGEENQALVRLAWDDTNLYLFAEVDDDIVATPESGDQIWQNDAVDIQIAVDGDAHQLTFDADGDSAHYIIPGSTISLGFAEVATAPRDGPGYVLEATFPWAEIGINAPHPGDEFVAMLTVFDNDGDVSQAEITANVPPGGQPLDERWFRGPEHWGTLTLDG